MFQIVASLIDDASIIIYDPNLGQDHYSLIVLANAIAIVNYNCTVITTINYNRKAFIVHTSGHVVHL
jgi:hypothetical protein